MAFKRLRGIPGKIYVPESKDQPKKHPCPDCFSCQWCGDNRCQCCRKQKQKGKSQ